MLTNFDRVLDKKTIVIYENLQFKQGLTIITNCLIRIITA